MKMNNRGLLNLLFLLCFAAIIACKKDSTSTTTTPPGPKADFSFSISAPGTLPATVKFQSAAVNAAQYSWSFGDGTTSTEINPRKIYTKLGTFAVKLLVSGSQGKDSITKNVEITLDKPKAIIAYSIIDDGNYPVHVKFTSSSTGAATYKWDFGNGDTSGLPNPTDSFFVSKTYNVKLVVGNAAGKDSVTVPVTVNINRMANYIDKSVVVFLLTPKDKKYNPEYAKVLKNTVVDLQQWYKEQMGNNKTFTLNPWVLDTLRGLHDSTWYNSNNGSISGSDPRFYGYYNTIYEMQQLLGNDFNTSKFVYFVYVAAPGGGAGASGFCAMGDQDLKGLLGKNPENFNPKRWIGGGGHELGHAFGLDHPDNQNPKAIMWTGYVDYPNCILQQVDKDKLNASPFFLAK